ncbi:MAG: asparagine synthase (glutamine-hydrolyzing) [Ignavibacteriaceae bacterium]|nr:asparagine synthase (glutamine-hydrolyzing) [Ignavibacteriaceae bacterium]
MCGITGYAAFNSANTIDRSLLEKMVNIIFHRGPDESGLDIRNGVGMGMRRLSIIDLSSGSQPIYNEDKTVWTVFNGEIYNFHEVKKVLLSKGHIFKTNSDTEVIVHGYEEYGSDFLKKLNGMFAIAVHDTKKNKLLLARDHIGIKPLYYAFNQKRIIFGSELKSILISRDFKPDLDIDALGEYLSWEYVPGSSTLIKQIKKLEPGYFLEIDLSNPSCEPKKYWDIPFFEPQSNHASMDEWLERIDLQLKKSTQMQLISDVPLGAFLSGGVDSSLIVSAMGEAKTFSIGFDDPTYNELGWAKKVANHLNVNHIDEIIKPEVLELFEHLMFFLDDPIGDFSIFPTYLVSRLARKHVTVALSGDGGDELFGGYETYLAQHKAKIFNRIPTFIRNGIIAPSLNALKPTAKKKGLINKAKRFMEGASYDDQLSHARWRIFVGEELRKNLFTNESLRTITKPPAHHIEKLFLQAGDRGELNRSLYVDVKSYLCDNILTKVDRMSMAVSLEARVPYLDPDLVTLAFQVPEEYKVTSNETKIILKKLASKYVPKECVYRPKEGFSIPIKNWLIHEFRPLMDGLLDHKKIEQEGIFNSKTVEKLKYDHLNGKSNNSHILWSLIVFQDWKRRWLEGEALK